MRPKTDLNTAKENCLSLKQRTFRINVDSCATIKVVVLQFGNLGLVLVPWELSSQSLAGLCFGKQKQFG